MNRPILACLIGCFSGACCHLLADQVEMQNGDRYIGKVLSLSADTLVLQSEVAGTLKLPRAKLSHVTFGPVPGKVASPIAAGTNAVPRAGQGSSTNAELPVALRQLAGSTNNALGQSPAQLLEAGGPEARAKFNELMSGLLTGKLSMGDIRAQAKTAADELRSMRRYSGQLGGEGETMLDGYLAILDKFLAETSTQGTAATAPKKSK
jgi:hypothetical protein